MQVGNSAITRLVSWQCLGVYMHRPFNQNSCGTLATVMKSLYICLSQWPSYLFSECLMSSLKMDIYHLFRVVVASTVLLLFLQVFTWNTNAMQGINSLWKVIFLKRKNTQPAAIYSNGVKLTHIKGQKPTYSLELIKFHIAFSCITGST